MESTGWGARVAQAVRALGLSSLKPSLAMCARVGSGGEEVQRQYRTLRQHNDVNKVSVQGCRNAVNV